MFKKWKGTWWRVSFLSSFQSPSHLPVPLPPAAPSRQPLWSFLSPLSYLRRIVTNIHIFLLLLFIFPSLKENKVIPGWERLVLFLWLWCAFWHSFLHASCLGVHWASWICEFTVLIKLGKFSSMISSNILSLLPPPLLRRLQLHIYLPYQTLEHLHY